MTWPPTTHQDVQDAVTTLQTLVGVRLRRSTAQSIPSAVETAISFDVEDLDTHGFHESVTFPTRITIPTGQDGTYLLGAAVQLANNSSGRRATSLYVNGTTQIVSNETPPSTAAGSETGLIPVTMFTFAAGDYFEAKVYQDSGSALNLQQYQSARPVMWAVRVF